MAIFPGEPRLASSPLILLLHFLLNYASFWDRPIVCFFKVSTANLQVLWRYLLTELRNV